MVITKFLSKINAIERIPDKKIIVLTKGENDSPLIFRDIKNKTIIKEKSNNKSNLNIPLIVVEMIEYNINDKTRPLKKI
ncbi:hypothetical protein A9267_08840 [Shewanella sp. UCD-FRSSP16_17]|nr:hypothetical protein A9267_08840 [Shewanella sp. UCD-FRSSP16_17]